MVVWGRLNVFSLQRPVFEARAIGVGTSGARSQVNERFCLRVSIVDLATAATTAFRAKTKRPTAARCFVRLAFQHSNERTDAIAGRPTRQRIARGLEPT